MSNHTEFEKLFFKIVVNDDEEAFKEIFYEYYSALCVYSNRFLNSIEDAEDIVQDSFLKIWKNRKKIEITSSFRNFLITTVKNSTLDFLRKKGVSDRYIEKQSETDYTLKTPEDFYTFNELQVMIGDAIQKLPGRMRHVFEMNRFKGMTYNEIAAQLDVSPKTVESDMGKALRILRQELKDYLPILPLLLLLSL